MSPNQYNSYNFEASFKNYLLAGNESKLVSNITVKNYLSDLRHFFGWMRETKPSINDFDEKLFTKENIQGYLLYLKQANLPIVTVNRRLSTLRKFGSFCISQGWLKENPAKHIVNVEDEALMTAYLAEFATIHPKDITNVQEFLEVIS